ncbi:MAG TPA: hypothetical protein VF008_09440 [Niastella sp.]
MTLYILSTVTIGDVQHDFNKAYPFLKLDFYKVSETNLPRKPLTPSLPFKIAGLKDEGALDISDSMTVGELENAFRKNFGLNVQVSRKSGNLWLETTISDKWTLKAQNDHGCELSHYDKKVDSQNDAIDYG